MDKERLVRWELPDGRVWYYKGERGFERLVRVGRGVIHFERRGETDAERVMRIYG